MSRSRSAFAPALALAFTACSSALALGYGLAAPWYGEAAALVPALAWLFSRRRHAHLCLCLSVVSAAIGVIIGAPAELMIVAATAALGLWDISGAEAGSEGGEGARSYARLRLRALLVSLGSALALAILAIRARFPLPFPVMVVSAALAFFVLDRLLRALDADQD